MEKIKYVVGIDEVGRGALAGPVVVAAIAISNNLELKMNNTELRLRNKNSKFLTLNSKSANLSKLRDSKKLSAKQREAWFRHVKNLSNLRKYIRGKFEKHIYYAAAGVSPKVIDKINISKAANLAAAKVFIKLVKNNKLKVKSCNIFLDGGLYINKPKTKNQKLKIQTKNIKTIIKGDEKIPAVALASIIAKVSRDKMMEKFHKKYPQYGFNQHKGYGTKKHFKAIKKFGASSIHRKSFNY